MKRAILISFFGSSRMSQHEKVYNAIYKKVEKEFPDYRVEICITSRTIKKILEKKGIYIKNEIEAYKMLKEENYEDITILSTNIIPGKEYGKIKNISNSITKAIINNYSDVKELCDRITAEDIGDDAEYVFMGHGSDSASDILYEEIDKYLKTTHPSYHIATVEGKLTLDDVIKDIKKTTKKIFLRPLMFVSGVHVLDDMINNEDSWFKRLSAMSYEVEVIDRGLGEEEFVLDKLIQNLKKELKPKLNIVGVGPGDPQLITLEALNTLRKSHLIIYLKNKDRNMALDIVKDHIKNRRIEKIDFNMTDCDKNKYIHLCEDIKRYVLEYINVSFITIGDPSILCTPMNIIDKLEEFCNVRIISGIPSFVRASAEIKKPILSKGEILSIRDDAHSLSGDNVVVLKASLNKESIDQYKEEYDISYLSRVSFFNSDIIKDYKGELMEKEYMSLFIMKKKI